MHLSLKSSLGRQILTGTYVKDNRVLDLTTPFSELTFTLEDQSGEGNDATLYSGRYISTDGSTDRGIVADCSAAGAGNYYLTGKVRPNAVTTAELTMDGSTDSGLTGLTADVWQTFTTATSAVTPSAVQVGYDGSTASAADWSDVKLVDADTGLTVARWQLNESADGDLDGYPALDSSGNVYHGTHTGCAGGTGEAGILQTAGMDWNKRIQLGQAQNATGFGSNFDWNIFTATPLGFDAEVSSGFLGAGGWVLPSVAQIGDVIRITCDVTFDESPSVVLYQDTTNRVTASAFTNLVSGHNSFDLTVTAAGNYLCVTDQAIPCEVSVSNFTAELISGTAQASSMLIPESSTAGTDALGNAIAEPRPTADTWNLFGDGEYGQVADADSLDVTTEATWEIWGNFYGAGRNEAYLAKYSTSSARSWMIGKEVSTAANRMRLFFSADGSSARIDEWSGLTDAVGCFSLTYSSGVVKAYWNGVLMTQGATSGTANSLLATTEPVYVGRASNLLWYADDEISRPKIYNRALTADEVLQNYNAQKGAFGL